jgi:plasmid stabilization system protein ParE
MIARMLDQVSDDLEQAYYYYDARSPGLGNQLIFRYRRGVDSILQFPSRWQQVPPRHRRYRIKQFPYGIVYRQLDEKDVLVVAFWHLSRDPRGWHSRDRY